MGNSQRCRSMASVFIVAFHHDSNSSRIFSLLITTPSIMRQRLQRLHPVDQQLLFNLRVCPVPLQCLFCCCQLRGARVDQVGIVVLDRYFGLANQNKPVAILQQHSVVLNPSVMRVSVDVQLDGISDSCHDYLGFSLLTFSPSKEGLFFIASLGATAWAMVRLYFSWSCRTIPIAGSPARAL